MLLLTWGRKTSFGRQWPSYRQKKPRGGPPEPVLSQTAGRYAGQAWGLLLHRAGGTLSTIHNLHDHWNLMREVRDVLDARQFAQFRAQFKSERARGV